MLSIAGSLESVIFASGSKIPVTNGEPKTITPMSGNDQDLEDMEQAMEDGLCPRCGMEIDNGAEDCSNPIHDLC